MLEDLKPPVKILSCKVRTIAATLNEKDAVIFKEACESHAWQPFVLSRELRKKGIEISDRTIKNHRLKDCSCWKI
jgi:hypothetical protein